MYRVRTVGPVLAAVVAAAAACASRDGAGVATDAAIDGLGRACTEVIGDLARPLEVRPVYVDRHDQVQSMIGGAAELIAPPQGGHVLLVGLEARNVRGCEATVHGRLLDPGSGLVLGEEARPSQLVAGDDGWGALGFPPIAVTANLMICPFSNLPRDVDGHPWRLELTLTEDGGRAASWAGEVVPFCDPAAPGVDTCRCQCDADFVFGEPCPVDP